MRGVRHALASVAALAIALASSQAAATENRPALRVLLVVDRPNDPLMARIHAEIAALGLTVTTSGPDGPLETSARAQHAVAAIRVLPSRNGVEVWMADATTGRTLTRQLVVDERPGGPDYTLVALQTAEILRTALFPETAKPALAPSPTPTPSVAAPATAAAPPAQAEEARVQAGIGGLYSLGGVDPALQVWLSLQRQWRHALGLALTLSGPVLRGSLSGPEGHSLVGAYLAGVELCSSFVKDDPHWFLSGGLGGGIVDLRAEGRSVQPLDQQGSASAFTGFGYARFEVGLRLSTWARLGVTGVAGTTFVPVKIRFAGNQAGTWGILFLASFLQLGVEWE